MKKYFFYIIGLLVLIASGVVIGNKKNSESHHSHYHLSYIKFFDSIQAYEETQTSDKGTIKGKVIYVGTEKLENKKN